MSIERAPEPAPLTSPEVRNDLKAAVGARHELGPEMEDHVIEAFLARIETKIDARVNEAISHLPQQATTRKSSSGGTGGHANFAAVVAPSLALSIPLVAIAGGTAGAWAVFSVMFAVLAINFMYFIYEMAGRVGSKK